MGKRKLFWIVLLFLSLLRPLRAEARFINLGGSLDLTYGSFKTKQTDGGTDKTTLFQQRYHLRNFGEIFSPRVGTLLLSGTFLQQDTKTNKQGNQDFYFNDYSAAVNLFPYVSPLSLYYQRVMRTNKFDGTLETQNKDRLTTIGGNWSLSLPRMPRIALSYNQSESRSIDDPNRLPNTLNRFVNLESSGKLGETTLIGRYQFNEADVARLNTGAVETISGNAFNLTTETRLAPAMVLSTFSRIANKGGGSSTGVTFSQERGIGASFFYTPSTKWDTHARIDYSETPGSFSSAVDLKRQSAFWSGSYRPAEELDMVVSARYFQFDISDVKTTSPFFDYTVNYRPFFGFSSGLGASYGTTETKGSVVAIATTFQRYRGYMNYTRALEVLRYTTSYSLAYGLSDTDTQGEMQDVMNTLSLRIENTRIRYVHLAMGYTFNDIARTQDIPAVNQIQPVPATQEIGDQRSHRFQINADSSYFRGLLFDSDSLILQGTTSWTSIEGFGINGTTFMADARSTYYFMRGAMLSGGWTFQDYPGGFYSDTHTFYEEIRWTFYLGSTSINFGARANQERTDGDSSFDRDTLETTTGIIYRVGKFMLSLDGRWSKDRSKVSAQNVDYETQSLFARMSRSF